MRLVRIKSIILSSISCLLYTSQPIASYISIAILSACGIELTTYTLFVTLSLIAVARVSVTMNLALPLQFLADFSAATNRIQNLLDVFELKEGSLTAARAALNKAYRLKKERHGDDSRIAKPLYHPTDSPSDNSSRLRPRKHQAAPVPCAVSMMDVSSFSGGRTILNSVCLSVCEGELVIVAGPVGSGKSSLLMAILQELPLSKDSKILCSATKAHVPQLAWVFSGTVRENILFGESMKWQKYEKALEACALTKDIEEFPDGDMTVIGERGVLLSGGQRARVGLARAVYADADVYLLDDPLSAVDAKVGKYIFEECIRGILSKKTRIVVTHCQQFLTNAERIVLVEEGSIKADGSQKELEKNGIEFLALNGSDEQINTGDLGTVQPRDKDVAIAEDSMGLKIEDEDRLTGTVTWSLYWRYFREGLSSFQFLLSVVFFLVVQGEFGCMHIVTPFDFPLRAVHMSRTTCLQHGQLLAVVLQGLGFRAWGSGLGARGSGLGARGSGLGARGSGLGARGSGLGARGLGWGVGLGAWGLCYIGSGSGCLKTFIKLCFFSITVFIFLPDWWVLHLSSLPTTERGRTTNLHIYAGLAAAALLLSFLRSLLFFNTALNSSAGLQDKMLAAVIKAPLLFFNTNPVGRVLNRFSTDLMFMDELLPDTFLDAIQLVLFCASAIILPSLLNPWVSLAVVPLLAVFLALAKYQLKATRELRRLEAINRSPVFAHFSDTLEGLVTIRTYGREKMFEDELYR